MRYFFTSEIWDLEIISVRILTLISITPLTLQPAFYPTIPQHPPPHPASILQHVFLCACYYFFNYSKRDSSTTPPTVTFPAAALLGNVHNTPAALAAAAAAVAAASVATLAATPASGVDPYI